MKKFYIFDPSSSDKLSQFRGGGRIIQILKENLEEAEFIADLSKVEKDSSLLVPFWKPFEPPVLEKRIASRQYLIIYDVIPLKYPSHFPPGLRGNLKFLSNLRNLNLYDKIITISQASKADIIKYLKVPEEKVEIIYPTLTKSFLNSKSQAPNPKQFQNYNFGNSDLFRILDLGFRYCLYVGDVNYNKNLVNLAKAIKLADVPCVFVGKQFSSTASSSNHTEQQDFKSFLELAKEDKRFIFLGYVKDEELIKLYTQAACNVLVSKDEGFGLSFLEAASQNCPSILSDISVFHEVAGGAALFANPNSPEDIAKILKEIFNPATAGKPDFEYSQILKKYSPENFRKNLQYLLTN